jgi:paraquat-inducible protein A
MSSPEHLICPFCDRVHTRPALAPGERAECTRCGTTLAERARFGPDTSLAFALAGAALMVPTFVLPFVHVSKFGAARASFAYSGVGALWDADMRLTGVWVLLCGGIVPLLLLVTLLALQLPRRLGRPVWGESVLHSTAHAFEQWAMPEVQLLATLVALVKLGSLVHVRAGPGLWCYAAMAVCLLVAWRSFELDPSWPARPRSSALVS